MKKAKLVNEVKELMRTIEDKWFAIDLDKAEIETSPYYYSQMASSGYYWGWYKNFYCLFDEEENGWTANILEVHEKEFSLIVQFYRDKGNELYPVESDESELPLMEVEKLKKIKSYLKKLVKKNNL